jgi:nucleotide-binding universal stress UspA family protein
MAHGPDHPRGCGDGSSRESETTDPAGRRSGSSRSARAASGSPEERPPDRHQRGRALYLPAGRLRRRVTRARPLASSAEIVRLARDRAQATLPDLGGDCRGDPDASRAEQADTIVLGSRLERPPSLVLGSVSSQVARQATCDVVVVPPDPSGASTVPPAQRWNASPTTSAAHRAAGSATDRSGRYRPDRAALGPGPSARRQRADLIVARVDGDSVNAMPDVTIDRCSRLTIASR